MKLPVLKVNYLPNLYKHCSTIYVLHLELQAQSEDSFMQSYLDHVRSQMYQVVENNFVTAQASRVYSETEEFLVFKSNIEEKQLTSFVEYLMAEIDEYCSPQPEQVYHFVKGMIFEKGSPIKMLSANKMGEELLASPLYMKHKVTYDHKKRPRGKQLMTPQEYEGIYERQNKTNKPLKEPVQEQVSEPCKDGYIEYYI